MGGDLEAVEVEPGNQAPIEKVYQALRRKEERTEEGEMTDDKFAKFFEDLCKQYGANKQDVLAYLELQKKIEELNEQLKGTVRVGEATAVDTSPDESVEKMLDRLQLKGVETARTNVTPPENA